MTSFQDRQKSLFNHLKDAEEQYSFSKSNNVEEQPDYGVIDRRTYRKVKREMKQFRGRESIYKRPDANLLECLRARSAPDYLKNPQKWQYYSLSDVTPEQMSDKTNTETALAFMREMEDRESKQKLDTEVIDETGAVFKKPTFNISKTINKLPEAQKKPVFQSNKIIMPEYVVGMSKKKINKPQINKKIKDGEIKKELKLNHLYEDNDADDDNEISNDCT